MTNSCIVPVNAILLLGPTGVGKSPLGDALAQKGMFGRQCHHLDFGSELRRAVGGASSLAYTVPELDFIHGVLERGLLLENEHFHLAEKIFSLFLGRTAFSAGDLLVLNGIPRHEGQARDIARIVHVHALIVLDCSAEEIMCRIRNNVGGDRTERTDDDASLIEKKLRIFRERTAPLLHHYEELGCKVYRLGITGTMTPLEAWRKVSMLAAADPPVTLVTEPPER
jgi:adenylate kinase family enzyme